MIVDLSILVIGIVILCVIHYLRNHKSVTAESFVDDAESYLHSCPSGYKSYHLTNGNTACCKGEIIANECMSDDVCLLNGKGTNGMQKCTDVVTGEYESKAVEQCPPSMSSYFEDATKKVKGCTAGPLNTSLTGPQQKNQPVCTIYDTMDMNLKSLNSCWNQKEMDEFACFGTNCTKTLVQAAPNAPIQIAVGFVDGTGMHRVAYTRASMQRFLDATKPTWRGQEMDLDKNVNVAEVAKAYYVDKTIQQDDVQL